MDLPKLSDVDEDYVSYREMYDGTDYFLSASTRTSLCLFCGAWYGWDEPHGQIVGGCYPPAR